MLTRSGPTSYFVEEGAAGPSGFEHDLVKLFADQQGLAVRFVVVRDEGEIVARLKRGEAALGAGWLTADDDPSLVAGPVYMTSENVVAQPEAALTIDEPEQLAGRQIHVLAGSRPAAVLQALHEKHPGVDTVEERDPSELELIARVAEHRINLALVDSATLDIASNYYPLVQRGATVGPESRIAWLFPPDGDAALRRQAAAFFARIDADGTLARLKDRYFGHIERLNQDDVVQFLERMRQVLPRYRAAFQTAQADTGIDWRLLAALSYQESQWNPLATSRTGVRGMMMLTEETADRLDVGNRLDAAQSIRAGAEYFADLRDMLPESVLEPDRTWMAVAAYNLGMGHFNGARQIAPSLKKDPDSWYEMKAVLPLLARPQYYQRLKAGRGRGGEAVIMAENVRSYFDILNRFEPVYPPFTRHRLSAAAGTPVAAPSGDPLLYQAPITEAPLM